MARKPNGKVEETILEVKASRGRAPHFQEYHCTGCGKRVIDAILTPGATVRVRCWHENCKMINVYRASDDKQLTGNRLVAMPALPEIEA